MFKNTYQGGPYFEVFNAQLSDSLQKKWKIFGPSSAIRKEYSRECKSWVLVLEGDAVVTKIRLPKDDKENLCLLQPFCILQVKISPGLRGFSADFSILDTRNNRRRIFLSTMHKELSVTPLHAKVPLVIAQRGMWLNLCLDMQSLVNRSFKGSILRSIESITIHANCKIRRIFTMKNQPIDSASENDNAIPKPMRLNTESSSYTQIFNMESVTHLEDNIPTSKSFTVLGRDSSTNVPSKSFERISNIEIKFTSGEKTIKTLVSDCEKIKSERGVSIYKFRNSEQMQNNEGSEIVGRKDVIPISYVAEYRSNLQSKIGYGSLKIPANGYSAEYDCNGNTDNHAWITVDIRTGEKLFTFFSFPISVRSEQSNIGVDYDTIALGNLGEYYPQFVDHESHSRINHSDYTLNCNQYDEIDVKGDGNDRNTANNINLQFEETTDNRIGDKGSTTTKEILGVNSCKESEMESVIRSVCGVNTNRDNRILSKASLKSSLLREISQTTISQDDDWKDLNLYGDSRTLYDCSTDHIPDFVSSHRLPKNFGESITIDEDTASSSENEDSTPGKRYPAQSIISRYVSEIRHNNVLASFQSNTRECAPVFSPDVNLSAVSIDSNSKWQILSSGDDGNCSTAQNLRQTGEVLDLLYDSQLNCYFDPKTYKYYELID